MKTYKLQLLDDSYLPAYLQHQTATVHQQVARLQQLDSASPPLSAQVASAIFSTRIDGNPVDFHDYYRAQELNLKKKTRPIQEVDDLVAAYQYASRGSITPKRLLTAYKRLSQSRRSSKPGYRTQAMGVWNVRTGQRIYQGIEPGRVTDEMQKLIGDIVTLVQQALSDSEVLYFAAQIHLRLVTILPFPTQNGLMARLLEKWFLAVKLGSAGWQIQSERGYHDRAASYFRHIHLGADYEQVDYRECLPFLLLLPVSLSDKPME